VFKHPITVIVKLLLSAQIKSAKTSNLISLRTLLILEICLLDKTMNLLELPKLIGTIICFLDRPFVIMLSLGLFFNILYVVHRCLSVRITTFVRNRLATEPVMLKVHNVKLSFKIWLVLFLTVSSFQDMWSPHRSYMNSYTQRLYHIL